MNKIYYIISLIVVFLIIYLLYVYLFGKVPEKIVDIETKEQVVDLSLFIYPSWEDPEADPPMHELDFHIGRDVGKGTRRVFAEFLHITDPIMELDSEYYQGGEVGVGIVRAGENHFGTKIENGMKCTFTI